MMEPKEPTSKNFKVFAEILQAKSEDGEISNGIRFVSDDFMCNPRMVGDTMAAFLSFILKHIPDKHQIDFQKQALQEFDWRVKNLHTSIDYD